MNLPSLKPAGLLRPSLWTALLVTSAAWWSASCGDAATAAGLSPGQPGACVIDCDCPQGQICAGGQCKDGAGSLFCCDKASCPSGERCVDRRGVVSTCLECVVDCDCAQGSFCDLGRCARGPSPTYCCEREGCPVNEVCVTQEQRAGVCPPECTVDCDCPQGQACSSSGICLPTSPPTYCCEREGCPQGQACISREGRSAQCQAAPEQPAVCGNGVVERGERCDADCPTSCDDGDACTVDRLLGANTCLAECRHEPISACVDGDGCCPAGCSSELDSDCPDAQRCGDGRRDPGESCDGDCPTSCDDGDACTTDSLRGSAAQCTAQCVHQRISACVAADGCCPAGCTWEVDSDCSPPAPTGQVGASCDRDAQCQGLRARCITQASSSIHQGGYCTADCRSDSECGTAGHCSSALGRCVATCRDNSQCRAGYVCVDDDGDNVRECAPARGAVGDACADAAQCRGAQAQCFSQDEGLFRQGYCSRACSTSRDCGAGATCIGTQDTICVRSCQSDADCRGQGYTCEDKNGDGVKECLATNNGPGQLGARCQGVWDCGAATEACVQSITGVGTFPGGYCTTSCTAGGACPAGTRCVGGLGLPFPLPLGGTHCVETCQTSSQCRAGLTCREINDGFTTPYRICAAP